MTSAPGIGSATLFFSPNPAATPIGLRIKAGLGVSDADCDLCLWQGAPASMAAARSLAMVWLRELASFRANGETLWDKTRVARFSSGNDVVIDLLGRLGSMLQLRDELTAFIAAHRPDRCLIVGLDDQSDLAETVRYVCAAHGIALEGFISSQPLPVDEPPSMPDARVVGAYEYQGTIGREIAAAAPGRLHGFDQLPPYRWFAARLTTGAEGVFHRVRPEPGSTVLVDAILDQVQAGSGVVRLAIANGRQRAQLTLTERGLVDSKGNVVVGKFPSLCHLAFWLDDKRAWVAVRGHAEPTEVSTERMWRGEVLVEIGHKGSGVTSWPRIVVLDRVDPGRLAAKLDWWRPIRRPAGKSTFEAFTVLPRAGTKPWRRGDERQGTAPACFEGFEELIEAANGRLHSVHIGLSRRIDGVSIDADEGPTLFDSAATGEAPDFAPMAAPLKQFLIDFFRAKGDTGIPVSEAMLDKVVSQLVANLRSYHDMQRRLATILDAASPGLMIAPSLDTRYRWAAIEAKAREIPTVSLEIAFMSHQQRRLHLAAGEPDAADKVLLWGDALYEELADHGLTSPAMAATGQFTLDFYRRFIQYRPATIAARTASWARLGVAGVAGPVVLFTSCLASGHHYYIDVDTWRETIAAAAEVVGRWNGLVVFKPLLHERLAAHVAALEGLPSNIVVLDPDPPFHNVHYIAASDVVVSTPTTMLAEAAAVGVPALTLALAGWERVMPIGEEVLSELGQVAPVVRTADEFRQKLESIFDGSNPSKPVALSRLFGKISGGNSAAVTDKITELLATRHATSK